MTAWQMREVDGAQAFNDHADAGLRRRRSSPTSARSTRTPRRGCGPSSRACRASRRTASASSAPHAAAAGRRRRYVASPRVDSYHGVWFELHEDLILLAGRNRADEVAAGRA